MRYIDISKLIISPTWLQKSTDALAILEKKLSSARSGYIDSMQRAIWKDEDFVQSMLFLVNKKTKKCWYSESSITDDVEIDHFRPKGRNLIRPFHSHYKDYFNDEILDQLDNGSTNSWWFLAFDYQNFRVCSCYRNQLRHDRLLQQRLPRAKGKADFFPLKKGSAIAMNKKGIEDEKYCLLDPCNPDDPQYLFHDNFGKIFTLYTGNDPESKWIQCRVLVSIAIYHLDETQLEEFRKQKWNDCRKNIYEELVNAIKQNDLSQIIPIRERFFNDFADKSLLFSAVAIDCIRHYKTLSPWLDKIFPDNTLIK